VRSMRRQISELPILIVTARDALRIGFRAWMRERTTYLVKPFEMRSSRLACARHPAPASLDREAEIRVGPLVLVPGEPRSRSGARALICPRAKMALLETWPLGSAAS